VTRGCGVCEALSGATSSIFETEHWTAVLSPEQGYLGSTFVGLKRHVSSLSELSDEEWAELHQVIKKFERAVHGAFGAQVFNWVCLMNNAFKAAEPKPHVHWRVRPRYDARVQVGEHVFADPNFAHHYDKHHTARVDEVVRSQIQSAIQACL
jgi:diadenosine tetraphosphate (Ap4A) HIT family hydrolase